MPVYFVNDVFLLVSYLCLPFFVYKCFFDLHFMPNVVPQKRQTTSGPLVKVVFENFDHLSSGERTKKKKKECFKFNIQYLWFFMMANFIRNNYVKLFFKTALILISFGIILMSTDDLFLQ